MKARRTLDSNAFLGIWCSRSYSSTPLNESSKREASCRRWKHSVCPEGNWRRDLNCIVSCCHSGAWTFRKASVWEILRYVEQSTCLHFRKKSVPSTVEELVWCANGSASTIARFRLLICRQGLSCTHHRYRWKQAEVLPPFEGADDSRRRGCVGRCTKDTDNILKRLRKDSGKSMRAEGEYLMSSDLTAILWMKKIFEIKSFLGMMKICVEDFFTAVRSRVSCETTTESNPSSKKYWC